MSGLLGVGMNTHSWVCIWVYVAPGAKPRRRTHVPTKCLSKRQLETNLLISFSHEISLALAGKTEFGNLILSEVA
jgi:hypothetical protein